eukprot:2480551-Amphidinium_carterae.1
MEERTIAMIKMNIKLPTPTMYDRKSPQFNEWSEEIRSYLTVHDIHIDDLLDESTKSQVPMVIATMQRDAVAQDGQDLQRFNARYPQAIHCEDGYDEYADRWEEKGGHSTIQPDIELCTTPRDKARFRTALNHETSDETIEWFRILETIALTFCRRPPCTSIFASTRNYAAHMGYQHKAVHEA